MAAARKKATRKKATRKKSIKKKIIKPSEEQKIRISKLLEDERQILSTLSLLRKELEELENPFYHQADQLADKFNTDIHFRRDINSDLINLNIDIIACVYIYGTDWSDVFRNILTGEITPIEFLNNTEFSFDLVENNSSFARSRKSNYDLPEKVENFLDYLLDSGAAEDYFYDFNHDDHYDDMLEEFRNYFLEFCNREIEL